MASQKYEQLQQQERERQRDAEPGFQERLMSRISKKGDSHYYITNLDQVSPHSELYRQPHLRSFYSNSFKAYLKESQTFCGDVSNLRLQEGRVATAAKPTGGSKSSVEM